MIAVLDVDYRNPGARAAAVWASTWTDTTPVAQQTIDLPEVAPYVPGAFYRRELPCLLRVLELSAQLPEIAVIDGYVWLDDAGRPGLGDYLYRAYQGKLAVVGIAKTAFAGADQSTRIAHVFRGRSTRPLYVSAVGLLLESARQGVASMAGEHRIPTLVSAADRLARTIGERHAT